MTAPFFSIITATRNAAAILPRLLDSLAEQTCQDFELVLQDGASADNTVAVAEAYRERLPGLAIVSAPDSGIYDAWNKAVDRARGEWILFLGADDELASSGVLAKASERLRAMAPTVTLAAASLQKLDSSGGDAKLLAPEEPDMAMNSLRQGRMPMPYPALFHRRSLFMQSRFDASFAIAGDYDFLCRTWVLEKTMVLDLIATRMYGGGVSDSPFSIFTMRKEVFRIVNNYFPGNISFLLHILPVLKGYPMHIICRIFGEKHAPRILDTLRVVRGLSPVWGKRVRNKP